MAVQITLEYTNVEEAIAALGKLAGIVAVGPKPAPDQPRIVEAKGEVVKPPRKGRSDAGQPRGPHKTTGEPAASEPGIGGQTSVAPSQPAAPVAPTQKPVEPVSDQKGPTGAASAVAPATVTPEQVQHRVESLFNAKGFDDAHATLLRFGVSRGKDLKPEQRGEFMARALDVIEGKLTATGAWPE